MTGATLTLRFGSARLRATVYWPRTGAAALALVLTDAAPCADTLAADCVIVALTGNYECAEELGALRWLAEHARDLGVGPERLIVAGGARAARLAVAARDARWPVLLRQVLVHPRFDGENPLPSNVDGVAPATIVHGDDARDDGRRYASLLRDAGVAVEEVNR
jgi:acetyl esterase/lipase